MNCIFCIIKDATMHKKTAHIATEKKNFALSFETEWHLESEMSVNVPYVSSA